MEEQELVCPQEKLRENCPSNNEKVVELFQSYKDFNVRVNAKTKICQKRPLQKF